MESTWNSLTEITLLSLWVSGGATVIALIIGVPAGFVFATKNFPGKWVLIALINSGMGLPPVVVGLLLMLALRRNGPLGFLELLFTPTAMIVSQAIIAFPVVTGLSLTAFQQLDPRIRLQTLALGASQWQLFQVLIKEARLPLCAALIAGFGAAISEVGAVLIVGGNIKNQTRVLTTAIVLEARMGHFDSALALGIILLLLIFVANVGLTLLQQKGRGER